MLKLYVMNQKLLLESKLLHEFLKHYYSTNYVTYCITTFIFVKIITGQVVFFSW